jgi:hypothetical protein
MAVDYLLEAGRYRFMANVNLNVQGSEVETELEGWVDGDDRELKLVHSDRPGASPRLHVAAAGTIFLTFGDDSARRFAGGI